MSAIGFEENLRADFISDFITYKKYLLSSLIIHKQILKLWIPEEFHHSAEAVKYIVKLFCH